MKKVLDLKFAVKVNNQRNVINLKFNNAADVITEEALKAAMVKLAKVESLLDGKGKPRFAAGQNIVPLKGVLWTNTDQTIFDDTPKPAEQGKGETKQVA
jgi:hypothetical protein